MGHHEPDESSDDIEEPVIVESAHRHGVAEADMLHALRFAIAHFWHEDDMAMFIGPDQTGNLIEVGVVTWHGILAIVHAMSPARDKYLKR